MTPTDDPTVPAWRRRWIGWLVAAIAFCAVAAIALWPAPSGDPPAAVPMPTPSPTGTRLATETRATTPAPTTPTAAATPGKPADLTSPLQVRVPSVGIAADVVPTAFKGGRIDPPRLDEVYWIEAYGAPTAAADNTVYLVGHSWNRGDAVFNPLIDRQAQTAKVGPGDEIVVSTPEGDVTYAVERTERYPKATLGDPDSAGYSDVWKVVPGRLVLITCFQRNDGAASQDNFVVYATLAA